MILDSQVFKLMGKLNDINDASPGSPVSNSQMSGSLIQSYAGMLGGHLALTAAQASNQSDTDIGTLYGGIYQYVKTKAASSAAPARGCIAFWDDRENYVVTPDSGTAVISAKIAGIYISAPTKGNYCFIQVAGKATVQFLASITKATPADGDLVVADGSFTYKADVLADATNLTSVNAKLALGVALEAPTNGGLKLVSLRYFNGNTF